MRIATVLVTVAIFPPTCVLADRDSSQQEEYYLKNFRSNPNKKGGFKFLRKKTGNSAPVDVVPQTPFGERDDYSIPKMLLFLPLVGAWMATLVLLRQVSPRVPSVISMICRHISEFTRRMSERTAAMHDKNMQQKSRMKRSNSSAKRRERPQESAASEQSISPSLLEIANMASDSDFDNSTDFENSGGTSLFSSFRRAKTVVASNSKRQERSNLFREPSPSRASSSKHKHATRMRRHINHRSDQHGEHESTRRSNPHHRDKRHHEMSYHKHEKGQIRAEMNHESSPKHSTGHVKSKSSRSHEEHNMSPLEKKLSSGSRTRKR